MSTLKSKLVANRYQLHELVGRGGCGVVFRATDLKHSQTVAVKMLSPAAKQDALLVERLVREQQALQALSGTHAVGVVDLCWAENGSLCLVMEWLDGCDLEQRLGQLESAGVPMALDELLAILEPVSDTLEKAHELGIVHRDIKPANIFILSDGRGIRLLDFGFSRLRSSVTLTSVDTVMGSPSYIAPEAWQAGSKSVGRQADLYAAGVIVFRALTGQLPFEGLTLVETMRVVTTAARPSACALRGELPPQLDEWVNYALAIEPARRFQYASTFKAALAAALKGLPLPEHTRPAVPGKKPTVPPPQTTANERKNAFATALEGASSLLRRIASSFAPSPKASQAKPQAISPARRLPPPPPRRSVAQGKHRHTSGLAATRQALQGEGTSASSFVGFGVPQRVPPSPQDASASTSSSSGTLDEPEQDVLISDLLTPCEPAVGASQDAPDDGELSAPAAAAAPVVQDHPGLNEIGVAVGAHERAAETATEVGVPPARVTALHQEPRVLDTQRPEPVCATSQPSGEPTRYRAAHQAQRPSDDVVAGGDEASVTGSPAVEHSDGVDSRMGDGEPSIGVAAVEQRASRKARTAQAPSTKAVSRAPAEQVTTKRTAGKRTATRRAGRQRINKPTATSEGNLARPASAPETSAELQTAKLRGPSKGTANKQLTSLGAGKKRVGKAASTSVASQGATGDQVAAKDSRSKSSTEAGARRALSPKRAGSNASAKKITSKVGESRKTRAKKTATSSAKRLKNAAVAKNSSRSRGATARDAAAKQKGSGGAKTERSAAKQRSSQRSASAAKEAASGEAAKSTAKQSSRNAAPKNDTSRPTAKRTPPKKNPSRRSVAIDETAVTKKVAGRVAAKRTATKKQPARGATNSKTPKDKAAVQPKPAEERGKVGG